MEDIQPTSSARTDGDNDPAIEGSPTTDVNGSTQGVTSKPMAARAEEPVHTDPNFRMSLNRCSNPTAAEVKEWRQEAMDFLANTAQGVFVLETFDPKGVLLQVKLSNNCASLFMNTLPWSMARGRTISKTDFQAGLQQTDVQAGFILKSDCVEFSPSTLVRFVLYNCDCVPALVSSTYADLFGRGDHDERFMEYIVYQKILPGSQDCSSTDCNRRASAVKLDTDLDPIGLFCTEHVRRLGISDNVLLYNPLIVAFTAHRRCSVLSALNLEAVYGPRNNSGKWSRITKPKRLSRIWTPLSRWNQPTPLTTSMPAAMMGETAKNVLDCADEHPKRGKIHNIGVVILHAQTCCLLKAFLNRPYHLSELPAKGFQAPLEDFPYLWTRLYKVSEWFCKV